MINNLTKKRKTIIIISSVVLILAITASIVLPILLNKNQDIGYSYEDENKPIEYDSVSKMVFYKKFSDILKYTFFITDKNKYLADGLLNAMSRARIPTEKMIAFVDYITDFADVIMDSGFYIPDGEFDSGKEIENNIFDNFNYHFMRFFEITGFSELELGRFLYELISDIAGEGEYRDLLVELGRDDFVAIIANTIYSYKMIMAATTVSIEAVEARTLQAIVYSLGSNYLKVINKLGFDGIEMLLGLNFDLERDYPNLSEEEYTVFCNIAQKSQGKVANLLYILGKSLTNSDAFTFEQLFSYFSSHNKNSLEAKESLILAHIGLSKAIKSGLQSSYVYKNITGISNEDIFILEYADLITAYKKLLDITSTTEEQEEGTEEQVEQQIDYDEYKNNTIEDLELFINCINTFSDIQTLQGMSAQEIDILEQKAKDMWKVFSDYEEFSEKTFSMVIVNFALKILDVEGFLERNRRAINDLIKDSLAGLIDMEELEGILGNNN